MEYEKSRNKKKEEYSEDLADSGITITQIQKMLDTFAEKELDKNLHKLQQAGSKPEEITSEISERLKAAYKESIAGSENAVIEADVDSLMKLAEKSEILKQAIISSPEEVMYEFMKFKFRYKLANDSERTKFRYLGKFIKHPEDLKRSQQFFIAACIVFGINLAFLIMLPTAIPFFSTFINLLGFGLMYKGYRYRGLFKGGIGNFIKSRFSKRSKSVPSDASLKEKLDEVGNFMTSLQPREVIRKNGNIYLIAHNFSAQECFYEVMVKTNGNIVLRKTTSKEVYEN